VTSDADVIVVGAGPGGSAAAYRLAQTGLDVLLLEKTGFPAREGVRRRAHPPAVKSLVDLGVDTSEDNGFIRNRGLRIIGGGMRLELPWPDLATYPDYGLVRPRLDFDELLARTAQKAGARLQEHTTVTGPVLDAEDRVVGVTAKVGPERTEVTYRAPLVIAADGSSARLALSLGIQKRDDRPMGVAVRRYFESPRHDDDMLESWLELRSDDGSLLPGYGWVFGVGDGTATSGWASSTPRRPGRRPTTRSCSPAGRAACRRVAVRRGARHRAGARRGAADGLQPHAALQPRRAAGRRRRRRGQPVQRRGHRVRDGVRPAGRRGRRAGARPPGRPEPREAPAGLPERMKAVYGGYYTLGRSSCT
jgi:2-polyprenyl-6-methoxyphenol hydroxylase-like FAD-dependent oxidoreductase